MIRKGRHVNHVITITIKQPLSQSINPILVLYANDSSEINAKPFDEIVRKKRSLSTLEPRYKIVIDDCDKTILYFL